MSTTTAEAGQSSETRDALSHDERERFDDLLNDEYLFQEWRDRRTAAFLRHKRIDRIGNVVGAALAALLLCVVLHACRCF